MAKLWKKGRGKLGFMQPLLGRWAAEAESPMGPLCCTRWFSTMGEYIKLEANWKFGAGAPKPAEECAETMPKWAKGYSEIALIGIGDEGKASFWSFTSDGKRSTGNLVDVTDLHAEAIGFEAQMPAGLARFAYWPAEGGGFHFAVESKNAKGWKRFVNHHYKAQ